MHTCVGQLQGHPVWWVWAEGNLYHLNDVVEAHCTLFNVGELIVSKYVAESISC